jgi:[ribosomal protein S5]-alanine N-acetyltransferase
LIGSSEISHLHMELHSTRLTLRRATSADFPIYLALVSDPEVMRFITGKGMTEQEARARFQISLDATAVDPRMGTYLILLRGTETCFGTFKFMLDRDDPAAIEIGYMLHAAYRGQGHATEAALRMIDFARTSPGIARVTAIADPNNAASRAVLTRCGLAMQRVYEAHGLPAADFELVLTAQE